MHVTLGSSIPAMVEMIFLFTSHLSSHNHYQKAASSFKGS